MHGAGYIRNQSYEADLYAPCGLAEEEIPITDPDGSLGMDGGLYRPSTIREKGRQGNQ